MTRSAVRFDSWFAASALLLATALPLAIGGCQYSSPVLTPQIWDDYPDSDRLEVYGADSSTAGQRVYAALKARPELTQFLSEELVPDVIEIQGQRYAPKKFKLVYMRSEIDPQYSITIEQTADGFIPRGREPWTDLKVPTVRKFQQTPRAAVPKPYSKPTAPTAKPKPSAVQAREPTSQEQLECPIAPDLPSCRAFCAGGAKYEWCS